MSKKSTRLRPKLKTKRNLVLPILIVATFLTACFGYFIYHSLLTPTKIAEVSSDDTSCPGFVEATISKTQVKPGEKFIVSCDYGRNDLDCIGTDSLPTSYNPCTFLTWDGTKAKWECTAQTNLGYYTQLCTNFHTDSCKTKNIPTGCQNFGVEYLVSSSTPITPPSKPVITTKCVDNRPTGTISWDKAYPETWIDIATGPRHLNGFANKKVTNQQSTTLTDFKVSEAEFQLVPNTQYYAWIFNGSLSVVSEPFTLPKCESKPPTPTNPKLTCSPDGKSVKFSWDSVNSIESYKIRLDNKKGTVTNYDNIKDTQKVIEINPNQAYSWWIHSHLGGYDSNQTTAVDFTCVPTTTPTPTPRPSIQPTPTPTPITYAIPSPKVLFDNTPTPTNTPNTIVDLTPSPNPESPTTKPGFFTRFFQWFSKLFN